MLLEDDEAHHAPVCRVIVHDDGRPVAGQVAGAGERFDGDAAHAGVRVLKRLGETGFGGRTDFRQQVHGGAADHDALVVERLGQTLDAMFAVAMVGGYQLAALLDGRGLLSRANARR